MDLNFMLDVDLNFDKLCRSCLRESDEMNPIFDNEHGNEKLLLNERIMACTQILILKDDGMPTKICKACTQQVNSAYDFKLKCEQSDATLRDYYLRTNFNNSSKDAKFDDNVFNFPLKPEVVFLECDPLLVSSLYYYEDGNDCNPKEDSIFNETPVAKIKLEKERFPCPHCDKTLVDKKGLEYHLRLHTGQNLKHCTICNRGFVQQNHLNRHMEVHTKIKKIPCKLCSECFVTKVDLKSHNERVHYIKPEKPKFKSIFAPSTTKTINKTFVDTKPFNDNNFINLDSDEEDVKVITHDESYEANEADLLKSKTQDGRFACHYCEKTLADTKGLKLHLRLHTGYKLKRCTICSRGFVKPSHLTRHMITHTRDRTKKCKHCTESFGTYIQLKAHMDKSHGSAPKTISTMTIRNIAGTWEKVPYFKVRKSEPSSPSNI